MVNSGNGCCLITVLEVRGSQATLLISHTPPNVVGLLDSWTAALAIDESCRIGSTAKVTLIDLRASKARLGIEASPYAAVHRLEVWQAIKAEQNRNKGDDPDGPAGSRVPRPGGPRPPQLDIRLDEPKPDDDTF